MATFKFGRYIDIHWNGYDIQGPAETVFSIPDQLYEEFNSDIAPVEPTLVWIDTNEFQTLQNSVTNYAVAATAPIAIASSTSTAGLETKTWSLNANYATSTHDHSGTYQPAGTYVNAVVGSSPATVSTASGTATVSISSGTAADGYVLTADGAGGVAFEASTGGLSSLVGTSPISATVVGSAATVSINSGTNPNGYLMAADGSGGVIFTPASTSGLTSVVGVSPISTAISGGTVSVSIEQASLSVADASTASTVRTYVKNSSGSTITKGQAVYVTGADGTNALIGLASASTDATSSKTLGIAANTMTNNAFGYVIENGQLSNIDTSAATAGSSVWLGATPGSLVFNSPPAEPNHFVYLGVVTKANVSTGEILVKVQNGYELNELHDVFTTGVSSSLPLVYNATSDGWIAQALSSVGIADNAIVTTKILDGAVTSAKLATDAVGAAAIAAGAVGTSELATGAVTSAAIASSAVTSGHIATGAVGSAALATASVTDAKIASNAVTSGHISTGAVGTAALATGAVVSAKIATGAVTSGHIATGAVGSAALADNSVVAAKIVAAAVGTSKIDSTGGSSGWVLTANGSGGVSFSAITSSATAEAYYVTGSGSINGSTFTAVPSGRYIVNNVSDRTIRVEQATSTTTVAASAQILIDQRSSMTASMPIGWTWASVDIANGTARPKAIRYLNSAWYIPTANGSMIRSTNGTSFSITTGLTTTGNINDVGFGGGTFVAAGASGALISSANGTSWTSRSSGITSNINAVEYGGSVFLIGANSGSAATSIDGASWTTRTSGFAATNISSIAYGAGLFVAVGGSIIRTTPDGITWTARSAPGTMTGNISRIKFANNLFVAVTSTTGEIITSSDGITWSEVSGGGIVLLDGIAYVGSSRWIVSGDGGTLAYSFDNAATWAAIDSVNNAQITAAQFDNGDLEFGDNRLIMINDGTNVGSVSSTNSNTFNFAMINLSSVTG